MSLSKDDNIIVDKDWIVCITDPIDSIKQNYEDKINGRHGRSESTSGSTDGHDSRGGTSGADGGFINPNIVLNE